MKRLIAAASGPMTAAACLLIARSPHLLPVIGAQLAIGAAAALVPPTLAALALGLAGRTRFDATISRNQSFNHSGNFVTAGLAGALGQHVGILWIFHLLCAFAAASVLSTLLIALRALLFFAVLMPETRDAEVEASGPSSASARTAVA